MSQAVRPLVWLEGEIKSPPFSPEARIEAGVLLRRLQMGEKLGLPHSRPMPEIGPRCHELRVRDENSNWRIFYHLATDAVLLLEIHQKTTEQTPHALLRRCQRRLRQFQSQT